MTKLEHALRNAEERLSAKVEAPGILMRSKGVWGSGFIVAVKVSACKAC